MTMTTTYTVSCSIGTLESLWDGKGVVASVTIPIASGAAAGTQFSVSATVLSSGNPNKNNTISDIVTVR
jgi:hypothetical protein